MLKVNDEKINLANKMNPYSSEVNRCYNYLRENYKFPVRLIYPPEVIKKDPDNPGRTTKPSSRGIEYSATVESTKGSIKWTYYETERRNKDEIINIPKKYIFTGNAKVPELQIDKLFFLIFKSPNCGNGLREIKKGNQYEYVPFRGRNVDFMIEDKEKEATLRVSKKAIFADINFAIYSENSPIDEDKLRMIAKAYGVHGVDELSVDRMKNSLMAQVEHDEKISKEKLKGFEKFHSLSDVGDETKHLALIRDAIDKNIISLDITGKRWAFMVNKKFTETILKIDPTKDNQEKLLADFLKENEDDLEFIKLALEEKEEVVSE